jgi:general secretion pathway protein E
MTTLTTKTAFRIVRGHLAGSLVDELARTSQSLAPESSTKLGDVLLHDAIRENATDVHLDPERTCYRVRFRIDGRLLDAMVLSHEWGTRLVRHFKAVANIDSGNAGKPADSRLNFVVDDKPIDLRLACAPSICGEKLAIRILDPQRFEHHLDEIGLASDQRLAVESWLANTAGMFIVAGPTGSGKTTTLYAMLHEMRAREKSVVTIEDPVEYQIDGIVQIPVDRRHGLSFAEGLRGMLRLDPDALLMGEIRDPADARAAVEAAGGGRVLMTTVHSSDAVGAIVSLRNLELPNHSIATAVRVVVAQRLVRRLCRQCRLRYQLNDADRAWLAAMNLPADGEEFWNSVGCPECRGIGYRGRIGIFEVWRLTDSDYTRILNGADDHTLFSGAVDEGMRTLVEDGFEKVRQGITSLDELKDVTGAYAPRRPHKILFGD